MPATSNRRRTWIIGGVAAAVIILGTILVIVIFYGDEWVSGGKKTYGLKFEPDNPDSSGLILVQMSDVEDTAQYVYRIENFLSKYKPSSAAVVCGPDQYPKHDQVCAFENKHIIDFCGSDEKYGYLRGSPCVLIYAHMDDSWQPQCYNSSDHLPENMPEFLQKAITHHSLIHGPETVWMSCKGEEAVDVENAGEITYFPDPPGYPAYYFPPKRHIDGSLDPVIAVKFHRPLYGVAVRIRCNIWAKNIPENEEDVTFVLRVD